MAYKQAKERDLKRKEVLIRLKQYFAELKEDFNTALGELFEETEEIMTYRNRKI